MAGEFNPDPWNRTDKYIDRTYPSGVARERPKLTTRIHCEPDREQVMRNAALSGPGYERQKREIEESRLMIDGDNTEGVGEACERFHRELRAGSGFRNLRDDEE